jgi:hypothetical protein
LAWEPTLRSFLVARRNAAKEMLTSFGRDTRPHKEHAFNAARWLELRLPIDEDSPTLQYDRRMLYEEKQPDGTTVLVGLSSVFASAFMRRYVTGSWDPIHRSIQTVLLQPAFNNDAKGRVAERHILTRLQAMVTAGTARSMELPLLALPPWAPWSRAVRTVKFKFIDVQWVEFPGDTVPLATLIPTRVHRAHAHKLPDVRFLLLETGSRKPTIQSTPTQHALWILDLMEEAGSPCRQGRRAACCRSRRLGSCPAAHCSHPVTHPAALRVDWTQKPGTAGIHPRSQLLTRV